MYIYTNLFCPKCKLVSSTHNSTCIAAISVQHVRISLSLSRMFNVCKPIMIVGFNWFWILFNTHYLKLQKKKEETWLHYNWSSILSTGFHIQEPKCPSSNQIRMPTMVLVIFGSLIDENMFFSSLPLLAIMVLIFLRWHCS